MLPTVSSFLLQQKSTKNLQYVSFPPRKTELQEENYVRVERGRERMIEFSKCTTHFTDAIEIIASEVDKTASVKTISNKQPYCTQK